MVGGVLMSIDLQWVFVVGALAALSGVSTFLGVLARSYGTRVLTQW